MSDVKSFRKDLTYVYFFFYIYTKSDFKKYCLFMQKWWATKFFWSAYIHLKSYHFCQDRQYISWLFYFEKKKVRIEFLYPYICHSKICPHKLRVFIFFFCSSLNFVMLMHCKKKWLFTTFISFETYFQKVFKICCTFFLFYTWFF